MFNINDKNTKCFICGKECYIDEKNNNFACSDKHCVMSIGYQEYLERLFSDEIKSSSNCEVMQFHQIQSEINNKIERLDEDFDWNKLFD